MFFEDFAVKELDIYVSNIGGEIRHYRDSNGLECDAVIHLKDGRYALAEIKLGGEDLIKEGINKLRAIRTKIRSNNQKEPEFSMIVTACGDSYTTDEGVHIVPINMLRD